MSKEKENKSTGAATTAAGRSLRPNSKNAEKIEKIKEDTVDDIVAKTAKILGTGKGFGGWTDTVEEDTYKKHVKKQHASREREKEEEEKEEPLVIHGPDGTRNNPQYSKFIYPKDVNKESVEYLDEGIGAIAGQVLETKSGKDGIKRLEGAFHWPSEVIRPSGRRKLKLPRQLKDPKSEMMVTSPKGKTFVIYKSEWPEHEKSGHTVAEEVEQLDEIPFLAPLAMGVARKVGGSLIKKGIGAVAGAIFKPRKAPGEEGTAPA